LKKLLLIALLILCSCSKTNEKYQCYYENSNFSNMNTLEVKGDKVTNIISIYKNQMGKLGYLESDVDSLIENNILKYQDNPNISYQVNYENEVLTETISYDLTSMTKKQLIETGLVENEDEQISLSNSLIVFKEKDYICNHVNWYKKGK